MTRPALSLPAAPDRSPAARAGRLRLAALAAVVALAAPESATAQRSDLLEPERAFALSARALDPRTVEVRYAIADGYYLYRDKIRVAVEPGALAAPPVLPPGKLKHDEFFGEVQTYRGELAVRLTLAAPAPGASVTLRAESQGCADAGVCYPPQLQKLALVLPAAGAGPGPIVEFAPAKKSWFR
jgi:thiol:disulfide interchange protein DsbD